MGKQQQLTAAKRATAEGAFEQCLLDLSSNLYHFLVTSPQDIRFLKAIQNLEGDWLCIIGSYSEDGTPVVAFGQGSTYTSALFSLGRTLAADKWKPDKFAK